MTINSAAQSLHGFVSQGTVPGRAYVSIDGKLVPLRADELFAEPPANREHAADRENDPES
jgi:hypothetical protein